MSKEKRIEDKILQINSLIEKEKRDDCKSYWIAEKKELMAELENMKKEIREQCKKPVRYDGKNFNGILYCMKEKGHDGLHYFLGSTK